MVENGSPIKRRLGKENRLAGDDAFLEVLNHGRRTESPGLKIFILKGKAGPPRLGIIAGRKIGGPVKRNRFKRRVREAVRQHPAFVGGVRVVVVAKPGAVELTFAEVAREIDRAFYG